MPGGTKKSMFAATAPTTTRTVIKIQRSGSCSSGQLIDREKPEEAIHIQLINKSTMLNYAVHNYKITSTSITMCFRIHNYNFANIFLKKLTIIPVVQINLIPVAIKINKIEMPYWEDYLDCDTSDEIVKLTPYKNTSLEFFGGQLLTLTPANLSITFSVVKPAFKNKHLNLSAQITEEREILDIKLQKAPPIPADSIYHGQASGHEFFRVRSYKRGNLLGSTAFSFKTEIVKNLDNTEIKTIVSLQMKNHLIESLRKDSNLIVNLSRMAEYKEYCHRLQKFYRLREDIISDAKKYCMTIDAEKTLAELQTGSSISTGKMIKLLERMDPGSEYIETLSNCKLEIFALETFSRMFVEDNDVLADYLSNNLKLIRNTPNIMIAWAIAKNVTLRIWEYFGQINSDAEKQMFPGQSHLLTKFKSLDILHDNITNKYYRLISLNEMEKALQTPLALKLRLFAHKPKVEDAPQVTVEPVRFSHDC